jgi:uncharacterized protein YegP (UPF0339 family)
MRQIKTWFKLPENIEFFVGNDGQHYFRVIADNGEPMLISEGYTTKWSAIRGARTVVKLMRKE